jgi:hypothetical protein
MVKAGEAAGFESFTAKNPIGIDPGGPTGRVGVMAGFAEAPPQAVSKQTASTTGANPSSRRIRGATVPTAQIFERIALPPEHTSP